MQNTKWFCVYMPAVFVCVCRLGSEPEGEFQVSHDVHPGVKGRLSGFTAAELSWISKSFTQ